MKSGGIDLLYQNLVFKSDLFGKYHRCSIQSKSVLQALNHNNMTDLFAVVVVNKDCFKLVYCNQYKTIHYLIL